MDQKRKSERTPQKGDYRARPRNNESQHSQESAGHRKQQNSRRQRTDAEQKPLKMCFAATHGKPCTKADLPAPQACRFAHSTQELQARIDAFQQALKTEAKQKEQAMRVEPRDESQLLSQMMRLLEERDRSNIIIAQRLETMQQSQALMLREIQELKGGIIFLGEKLKAAGLDVAIVANNQTTSQTTNVPSAPQDQKVIQNPVQYDQAAQIQQSQNFAQPQQVIQQLPPLPSRGIDFQFPSNWIAQPQHQVAASVQNGTIQGQVNVYEASAFDGCGQNNNFNHQQTNRQQ